MSAVDLDKVIEAQASLIAALDGGRIDAIEAATARLGAALTHVRGAGAWRGDTSTAARVDYALRQSEAAAGRVNFLADWNRQRLDRIAVARGSSPSATYNGQGKSRLSLALR